MSDLERIRMLAAALRMLRARPMSVTEQQLIDSVLKEVDEDMERERTEANAP